jgi:hypothetical protein
MILSPTWNVADWLGSKALEYLISGSRRFSSAASGPGGRVGSFNFVLGKDALIYVVQIGLVGVEGVHASFVPDPQDDEETTRKPEDEAKDIDEGEGGVAGEAAPGRFE